MKENKNNKLFYNRDFSFEKSVYDHNLLPQDNISEIAFTGRSNVGKSSLLNRIVGVDNLAKTSKTPGRTRMLNSFISKSRKLRIIDTPGYGYAKASDDSWNNLMRNYFEKRAQLKITLVLIDSRRGLMSSDKDLLNFLTFLNRESIIVLTKTDKVSSKALEAIKETVMENTKDQKVVEVLHTTIKDKSGLISLKKSIKEYIID